MSPYSQTKVFSTCIRSKILHQTSENFPFLHQIHVFTYKVLSNKHDSFLKCHKVILAGIPAMLRGYLASYFQTLCHPKVESMEEWD